jgi:hypothetical protein
MLDRPPICVQSRMARKRMAIDEYVGESKMGVRIPDNDSLA